MKRIGLLNIHGPVFFSVRWTGYEYWRTDPKSRALSERRRQYGLPLELVKRNFEARLRKPTTLDYPRNYSSNKGHGEGVIDMKLKRSFGIIVSMVRQNVQESPHQVKVLTSYIRYLKNGAYPLTDKLSSCLNCLLPVLNEYRYFPSTRRL